MSDHVDKKESAQEKDFVTRQEREALKRMLAKMDAAADPGNKKALAALEAKLSASGTKVTEQMKKDLLEWKQTAH